MKAEIAFLNGPLRMDARAVAGCGAVARFEGIVREEENGIRITGIEYEAYSAMAERISVATLHALDREHPVELVRLLHRTGFVPVGEAAVILEVHARRRAEAFAVLVKFMDRLKLDVPIWKTHARTDD